MPISNSFCPERKNDFWAFLVIFCQFFLNLPPTFNTKHSNFPYFVTTFTNFSQFFSIISKPSVPKISCLKTITPYITTTYKIFKQIFIHNQNPPFFQKPLFLSQYQRSPNNERLFPTFHNYFNTFKTKKLAFPQSKRQIICKISKNIILFMLQPICNLLWD